MENKSSISVGGTIILLALFAQNLIFGQGYISSRSSHPVSHFKKALKYKKEYGRLSAWNERKSREGGEILLSWYWKYTPLYEKGIKETQNKPMETTSLSYIFSQKGSNVVLSLRSRHIRHSSLPNCIKVNKLNLITKHHINR